MFNWVEKTEQKRTHIFQIPLFYKKPQPGTPQRQQKANKQFLSSVLETSIHYGSILNFMMSQQQFWK